MVASRREEPIAALVAATRDPSAVCGSHKVVSNNFAVRALTSLTAENGHPLWPTPAGATHLDSYTVEFTESHNQIERLKADALVLIAITDAGVDLSQ